MGSETGSESYDDDGHSRNNTEFMDNDEYGRSMSKMMMMNMGNSAASGIGQNYIGGDIRPMHPDDEGMDSEENLNSETGSEESWTENSGTASESEDDGQRVRNRQQASFSVVTNHQK